MAFVSAEHIEALKRAASNNRLYLGGWASRYNTLVTRGWVTRDADEDFGRLTLEGAYVLAKSIGMDAFERLSRGT